MDRWKSQTVLTQASLMQDEQGGTTPSNWSCTETTSRGSGCGGGGRRREAPEAKLSTHHDAIVDEAAAVASRFQVWIFLRARHPDGPNLLPSLVQLHVDRVHTRVVGGHSVPHVSGDAMLLQGRECGMGDCEDPKITNQSLSIPSYKLSRCVSGEQLGQGCASASSPRPGCLHKREPRSSPAGWTPTPLLYSDHPHPCLLLSPTEQSQPGCWVKSEEIQLYRTVDWFISVDTKRPGSSELEHCPS